MGQAAWRFRAPVTLSLAHQQTSVSRRASNAPPSTTDPPQWHVSAARPPGRNARHGWPRHRVPRRPRPDRGQVPGHVQLRHVPYYVARRASPSYRTESPHRSEQGRHKLQQTAGRQRSLLPASPRPGEARLGVEVGIMPWHASTYRRCRARPHGWNDRRGVVIQALTARHLLWLQQSHPESQKCLSSFGHKSPTTNETRLPHR